MTTALSKDGVRRRVILNESIVLVNSEDNLSFYLKDATLNTELTLNFVFTDDGEEYKTSGNISDDGKTLNMVLHKWDSSLGAEVTTPIELSTPSGKRIWLKFKTWADKKNFFRSFHLTIWAEE